MNKNFNNLSQTMGPKEIGTNSRKKATIMIYLTRETFQMRNQKMNSYIKRKKR